MNFISNENPLAYGWKYFDIMHKDRKVARIYEDGHCTIAYPSYMPYSLYLDKEKSVFAFSNNLVNFYAWCSSRVLMLDRKYAKEILNSIGASQSSTDKERAAIAISYHGLSLLDVYWIRSRGEKRQFSELSLYRHSLSEVFVDICLRGKPLTVQNSELYDSRNQAPDLGTPGVAPKAWIRKDNTFYLLKDGNERDVYAELLASKIVDCFAVESVHYEEDTFQECVVSKSQIITSEERSIVAAEHIEIYCANKERDTLKYILSKDSYNFHMMNIMDYLIGNIDRHWGNWGFYVNNEGNSLMGLYPLMDFNKAFLSYQSMEGTQCQTYLGKRISQKEAAILGVQKVGLNQIAEIDANWFMDDEQKDMFFRRLELLKSIVRE